LPETANQEPLSGITLEKLSVLIGIATAIAFVTSAIFEYTYLSKLGVRLNRLPLTFSDISKDVLIWLPATGGIIISSYTSDALARYVNPSNRLVSFANGYRLFYIFLILLYPMLGDNGSPFAISGMLFMFADVLALRLMHGDMKDKFKYKEKQFVVTTILLLSSIIVYAFYSASTDIKEKGGDQIFVSGGGVISAKILRSYEEGYLIYADKPQFLYKSEIKSIVYRDSPVRKVGIPCRFANLLCPDPTGSSVTAALRD
jgi:hypothetical protein